MAPGAPPSPGTVPLELSRELRSAEVAVWWDEKTSIAWSRVLWTVGVGVGVLAFATLFAPEFWSQSLAELWKPAAAPFLPALLVVLRERLNLGKVLVTDGSIVVVDAFGKGQRVAWKNLRRVRRDLITGGIRLDAAQLRLRVPADLADDCREAIASQTRNTMPVNEGPDDPMGWLPR